MLFNSQNELDGYFFTNKSFSKASIIGGREGEREREREREKEREYVHSNTVSTSRFVSQFKRVERFHRNLNNRETQVNN